MGLDTDALCTKRLAPGGALQLRDAAGYTVMCCAGVVWITQENDIRDIFLAAGERFTFDRKGLALIRAEKGMQDEWMADTGITVICLPARLVLDRKRES